MRADGSVLDEPGYDPASRFLFLPAAGEAFPAVPDCPTDSDVAQARALLELLVSGFPFVLDSDRANYLGALFTPLLRPLLPPPYPMFGIGAPMLGSGKTLLADLLRIVHGGVFRSEFPREEAEVRKAVTTILRDTTAPVVHFDNVKGTLRSGTLEGLLTSASWTDRLLGVNETVHACNDRLWVVVGNALSFGGDLYRRVIEVTIDPNMSRPWERPADAFEIKLPRWAQENRKEILHALLVPARAWVVAGRPVEPETRTDSYGDYVQGVRGLLRYAGFAGTFDDPATRTEPEGDDDTEWAAFLAALLHCFGRAAFTTADIVAALRSLERRLPAEYLPAALAEKWDQTQFRAGGTGFSKTLGLWLRNRCGRFAGELTVRRLGSHTVAKTQSWRIEGEPETF